MKKGMVKAVGSIDLFTSTVWKILVSKRILDTYYKKGNDEPRGSFLRIIITFSTLLTLLSYLSKTAGQLLLMVMVLGGGVLAAFNR